MREGVPQMLLDRAPIYGDQGLWLRRVYREIVGERRLTAVVRLGDRSDPGHKNYIPPGVPLPIRFIERTPTKEEMGKLGKRGLLLPDDGTTFERTDHVVKKIGELTEDDLRGTAPDTATPELVRYHIATINDSELPSLDTVVTIWRFQYLPDATEE